MHMCVKENDTCPTSQLCGSSICESYVCIQSQAVHNCNDSIVNNEIQDVV